MSLCPHASKSGRVYELGCHTSRTTGGGLTEKQRLLELLMRARTRPNGRWAAAIGVAAAVRLELVALLGPRRLAAAEEAIERSRRAAAQASARDERVRRRDIRTTETPSQRDALDLT